MGRIYYEKRAIPIPDDATVVKGDGRVYIYQPGAPKRRAKRLVIGKAATETTMHPNDTYRQIYPAKWEMYYGRKDKESIYLSSGAYGLVLAAGIQTGLYPLLLASHGPLYANALMDLSMYSMLENDDVALTFKDRMEGRVVFSKDRFDDDWISDLFRKFMTEEMNEKLREEWLSLCEKKGTKECWLSIDGSNNNCEAKECSLSEKGHAKSGKNIDIVSYMYAVDAEDGTPLTYDLYNGGMVDSKGIVKIVDMLSRHNIKVKGIILDRGFCTHDVIELLDRNSYEYVMMMPESVEGFKYMLEKHGEEIFWNCRYLLSGESVFGTTDKDVLIFAKHEDKANVSLFFDGRNSPGRMCTAISKLFERKAELEKSLKEGKKPSSDNSSFDKYLIVNDDGSVSLEHEGFQKLLMTKGFSSIASSLDIPASEVNRIYNLRDASEKQYIYIKTHLGFHVTRVHSEKSIRNKFLLCFVASILRSSIQNACKKNSLNTNEMLQEFSRISISRHSEGTYVAIHNESGDAKKLLLSFGMLAEDFDHIAAEYGTRLTSSFVNQVRDLPEHSEEELAPPKKGGRKAGSKNKKHKTDKNSVLPKRKPGRPKGAKDKTKRKRRTTKKKEE